MKLLKELKNHHSRRGTSPKTQTKLLLQFSLSFSYYTVEKTITIINDYFLYIPLFLFSLSILPIYTVAKKNPGASSVMKAANFWSVSSFFFFFFSSALSNFWFFFFFFFFLFSFGFVCSGDPCATVWDSRSMFSLWLYRSCALVLKGDVLGNHYVMMQLRRIIRGRSLCAI